MDLDGPRASALSVLVFVGPMPIGQLATMEHVSAPAITKTVTALEQQGLVRRERSGADRRIVTVRATAKGRALLERGRAARVRAVAQLLAECSEAEIRALGRAATLIARLLAT
jgi:DNA-binding MarR family transcriptional regulator